MTAQWKKFTGSEEQISEILEAKNGWIVKFKEGYESSVQCCDFLQSGFDKNDITNFMLCQPHPHADMIIEWARTGREVYVFNTFANEWRLDKVNLWSPDLEYSFNPDGDGNGKI